ncbi:ELFLESS ISOFORM B [Salix viminalis]|uniref:ELFLESS ISOFORM B n=1 Tax=Salix viminalis TaxID=40686 RepID=A0A9Q0TM72_SALVM|nr:ELFLESS ISOFORM B [Salix viminalis]
MSLLENFDNNMIFVENLNDNKVFLDNGDNTLDLLGNTDRLEDDLREAERICFQHYDLNCPPPIQNNMPFHRIYFPCHDEVYGQTRKRQTAQDVEIIDEDIAIISPNIFDQARKKARRNTDAVRENINISNQVHAAIHYIFVFNWKLLGIIKNLNSNQCHLVRQARTVLQFHGLSQPVPPPQFPGLCQSMTPPQLPGFSQTLPPAQVSGLSQAVPPPAAPSFRCPICMDELEEATTTKCGHVFCKNCIKKALAVQKKCPTCRMKCRAKSIYRIFLPTAL